MRRFAASLVLLSILVPATALALEGNGPRVTIQGIVEEIRITDKNKWDEFGGEMVVKAKNNQMVTIVMDKDTKIISEGRLSRRQLLPTDVRLKMEVRVTGRRVNGNTINASLFVITNIEKNASLTGNGLYQSSNATSVTLLLSTGETKTFSITSETEVNVSYTLWGADGLTLVGKRAYYTMNPENPGQLRVLRIDGAKDFDRTSKPSTVEFGRRTE